MPYRFVEGFPSCLPYLDWDSPSSGGASPLSHEALTSTIGLKPG